MARLASAAATYNAADRSDERWRKHRGVKALVALLASANANDIRRTLNVVAFRARAIDPKRCTDDSVTDGSNVGSAESTKPEWW